MSAKERMILIHLKQNNNLKFGDVRLGWGNKHRARCSVSVCLSKVLRERLIMPRLSGDPMGYIPNVRSSRFYSWLIPCLCNYDFCKFHALDDVCVESLSLAPGFHESALVFLYPRKVLKRKKYTLKRVSYGKPQLASQCFICVNFSSVVSDI